MSREEAEKRRHESRKKKQEVTKKGKEEEGDESITDKRAGEEQTGCHPTVTSHNLLCSAP